MKDDEERFDLARCVFVGLGRYIGYGAYCFPDGQQFQIPSLDGSSEILLLQSQQPESLFPSAQEQGPWGFGRAGSSSGPNKGSACVEIAKLEAATDRAAGSQGGASSQGKQGRDDWCPCHEMPNIGLMFRRNNEHGRSEHGILTEAEYQFYCALKRYVRERSAQGTEWLFIYPKVSLHEFVAVNPEYDFDQENRAADPFNYIRGKNVDFLLCDPQMRVVYAIEYDDSSHDPAKGCDEEKVRSDNIKTLLCKRAGVPLLRFAYEAGYADRPSRYLSDKIQLQLRKIEAGEYPRLYNGEIVFRPFSELWELSRSH